jgi:hypothetical protein
MFRVMMSLLAVLFLAACGADNKWASDDEVARARYVDPGPPSITLFTSINTRQNSGAHSGLLINGSQRVLFDPAGSFAHPAAPERHDVLFGITPVMLSYYVDYQGTAPFHLIQQTVYVSPEVAELVMQRAMANGAVSKAACTQGILGVLDGVPGFENLPNTWFPRALSTSFGRLPGVVERTITSEAGVLKRSLPGEPLVPLPEAVATSAPAS